LSTPVLSVAGKEVGLDIDAENASYVFMFFERNAGQNCDIKTASESYENEAEFKYLETTPKRWHFTVYGTARHDTKRHDMTR
jgi:hypothetical protein